MDTLQLSVLSIDENGNSLNKKYPKMPTRFIRLYINTYRVEFRWVISSFRTQIIDFVAIWMLLFKKFDYNIYVISVDAFNFRCWKTHRYQIFSYIYLRIDQTTIVISKKNR